MRMVTALAAAGLFGGAAMAATLPAGDAKNIPVTGASLAGDATLAGPIVQETSLAFAGKGIGGHVQLRIVKSAKTGGLHYYWRLSNAATSKGAINALNIHGWPAAAAYEVAYRSDSDGTGRPLIVSRYHNAADPDPKQKLISFYFDPKLAIAPNQSSRWFFMKTTATTSMTVNLAVYGTSGFIANVAGFGPK